MMQLPGVAQLVGQVVHMANGMRQLYEIERPLERGFIFKDNNGLTYGTNVDFSPIAFPGGTRQVSVMNRPTSAGALLLSLFDQQKATIFSGAKGITVEVGQEIDLPIVAFYFQVMSADTPVALNYEVRGYR